VKTGDKDVPLEQNLLLKVFSLRLRLFSPPSLQTLTEPHRLSGFTGFDCPFQVKFGDKGPDAPGRYMTRSPLPTCGVSKEQHQLFPDHPVTVC
jgi:hypothetical protein